MASPHPRRSWSTTWGARGVHVQGGYTAQRALEEGVLDEIQLALVPVLLGRGHRLFDLLPSEIELDIVRGRGPARCRTRP